MKQTFLLGIVVFVGWVASSGPAAGQSPTRQGTPERAPAAVASAQAQRAVLDQYCVVCHNDKLKTANFSLQNSDLAAVGEHPEVWEKVVRKLRAGIMPPPGVR